MIAAMRRFNVSIDLDYDAAPDGYRNGHAKLHPQIGAQTLFGGLFELPPGQSTRPYHYESSEEWLLVLEGRPTLRHAHGEDELETGDLVCLPAGPDGAHKITNRGDGNARVLIVSTRTSPAVAVFPDSDKIAVVPDWGDTIVVRRDAGTGYYDGEG